MTECQPRLSEAEFNKFRAKWRESVALDLRLKPLTVRVLLIIESHYLNKKSRDAYPLISTLAQIAGVSDRAVRSAISEAKANGYLTVQRRGRDRSSLYRLAIPEDKSGSSDPLIDDERQEAQFRSTKAKIGSTATVKQGQDRQQSSGHKEPRAEAQFRKTGNSVPQDRKHSSYRTSGQNQRTEPEGAAASSGGPPVATVSPTSTVVEDTRRDAQTGEEARFKSAPPPPNAAEEKEKPKYPKGWADGLSDQERRAELQAAGKEWQRLLDKGEDEKVIRAALWAYCKGFEEAVQQGAEVSRVPPPSQWMRDRWFEHREWWGLPAKAHCKSPTPTVHGG